MCNCKHRCFELQEIVTLSSQVFLPDNSRVRENLVTSVYIQPSDPAGSLTYLSPLGNDIAEWDVLNSTYLFVVNQSGTTIAKLPVAMLLRTTEYPEPLRVSWLEVDPTQTYFKINTTASGYAVGAAIVIVFGLACNECGLTPNLASTAKKLAEGVI